jgi:PilZ domain
MQFLARQRQPIDLSLGGVRIYSDDRLKVGELLKMEFFLDEKTPVIYTAEVVWIEALKAAGRDSKGGEGRQSGPTGPTGQGSGGQREMPPARFDVGLKFLDLEPAALKLLVSVLGPLEEEGQTPAEAAEPTEAGKPGEAAERPEPKGPGKNT